MFGRTPVKSKSAIGQSANGVVINRRHPKSIPAIKKYFESNGGRKIQMSEMKELTHEERQELGEMCAKELGEPFEAVEAKKK